MGRKRKDGNPLGLEQRVYWHHGQFIYRHRDGRVERLGTDLAKANQRAKVYNDPEGRYGTFGHFIDLYLAAARGRRLLRNKKPRTIADNEKEAEYLKAALGKYFPQQLVDDPSLIADYRNNRSAKVRANRELSLGSAVFTWLIESGDCPGLKVNPFQLVQRNPEEQKDRYVEDQEFEAVYGVGVRSVCMAMMLTYRTLQRPSDVLRMGAGWIREKRVAGTSTKVLSVTQGKTGRTVDIEITPAIEDALRMLTPDGQDLGKVRLSASVTKMVPTLVRAPDLTPYTLDGIGAMLRRYCKKAGVKTFGLMDVRAKGATDMYLAGVPLEKIQMLMGHESVTTTEIYIKRMMQTITIAKPNELKIGA